MGKSPAFQLYAADFYMDTAGWTATQIGAYMRLLMYEWVNGGVPESNAERARIAGIDHRNMAKMWSVVMAKKFTLSHTNMYVNPRMEKVRQEQEERRELRRLAGEAGAQARWKDDGKGNATALAKNSSSSSSSSSSSLEEKLYVASEEATHLSEYLKGKILKNNPKAKVNDKDWARVADLMIRIDERTPEEIRQVIDFSQGHDFWFKNILSMGKLRKQFDRLTNDMKGKPNVKPKGLDLSRHFSKASVDGRD